MSNGIFVIIIFDYKKLQGKICIKFKLVIIKKLELF